MPLAPMQKSVDTWIAENGGYWDEMSMLCRLFEEVGELSREYNHRFGAKKKKATEDVVDLEGELGDVLFILICLANKQGIDLDEALAATLRKYRVRDATRWG
jgi:NTP pyrophosphatase (non-canonical NTP hydrolase)